MKSFNKNLYEILWSVPFFEQQICKARISSQKSCYKKLFLFLFSKSQRKAYRFPQQAEMHSEQIKQDTK